MGLSEADGAVVDRALELIDQAANSGQIEKVISVIEYLSGETAQLAAAPEPPAAAVEPPAEAPASGNGQAEIAPAEVAAAAGTGPAADSAAPASS